MGKGETRKEGEGRDEEMMGKGGRKELRGSRERKEKETGSEQHFFKVDIFTEIATHLKKHCLKEPL